MSDTVFFHEDYENQIELIPEQNYFRALLDLENLPAKDEIHYGFPNAIIRREHLVQITDLKICQDEFLKLLGAISINYFNKVSTGYGNSTQIKKNTVAFGFERLGIFVSFDAKIITNIWICLSPLFIQSNHCPKLLSALHILGSTYNLALIDWDEEIIVRLSNLATIKEYLINAFEYMIPNS